MSGVCFEYNIITIDGTRNFSCYFVSFVNCQFIIIFSQNNLLILFVQYALHEHIRDSFRSIGSGTDAQMVHDIDNNAL